MQRLIKVVFKIFVFLLPTQLAYHFWPDWALVFGIRVDYLAPAIYLSDILAIILILLYFLQKKKKRLKINYKTWLPVILFVFLNVAYAKIPQAAFFKWSKILELYLVFLVVKNYKPLNFYKDLLRPLIFSSLAVSLIGIAQFLKGQTLGGAFYLLGERTFSLFTPGIALVRIFDRDFIRAYSTFSHPNSLAGFLSVVLILGMSYWKKWRRETPFVFAMMGILICLLLSFSLGAGISLILIYLFYKFFKKKAWAVLVLTLFASVILLVFSLTKETSKFKETVQERLVLARASQTIFLQSPIVGIGFNNFTAAKVSWSLQPVHNIYLLVLSETGIAGLFIFLLFLANVLKKSAKINNPGLFMALLFILFTGLADHYSLTLQQNLLLFSLVLGYSLKHKLDD